LVGFKQATNPDNSDEGTSLLTALKEGLSFSGTVVMAAEFATRVESSAWLSGRALAPA
jgi:hypothetical protein